LSNKKNFILRLDPETFKALEKWAADEFRSVNGQVEYILHNAILQAGRTSSGPDSQNKKSAKKK
jgi:hypothetical protein